MIGLSYYSSCNTQSNTKAIISIAWPATKLPPISKSNGGFLSRWHLPVTSSLSCIQLQRLISVGYLIYPTHALTRLSSPTFCGYTKERWLHTVSKTCRSTVNAAPVPEQHLHKVNSNTKRLSRPENVIGRTRQVIYNQINLPFTDLGYVERLIDVTTPVRRVTDKTVPKIVTGTSAHGCFTEFPLYTAVIFWPESVFHTWRTKGQQPYLEFYTK